MMIIIVIGLILTGCSLNLIRGIIETTLYSKKVESIAIQKLEVVELPLELPSLRHAAHSDRTIPPPNDDETNDASSLLAPIQSETTDCPIALTEKNETSISQERCINLVHTKVRAETLWKNQHQLKRVCQSLQHSWIGGGWNGGSSSKSSST
jgi:hypothetical protein